MAPLLAAPPPAGTLQRPSSTTPEPDFWPCLRPLLSSTPACSRPPTPPLAPGGGVASPFGFAADGERVYFLAFDAPDAPALFRVAVAASGDALRLSEPDEIVAGPLVLPPVQ